MLLLLLLLLMLLLWLWLLLLLNAVAAVSEIPDFLASGEPSCFAVERFKIQDPNIQTCRSPLLYFITAMLMLEHPQN